MQNSESIFKCLLDALLPNRAAPVLARVLKAYAGPGKGKYSVDVKVLKAGTLEETNQEISEVPITPVWANKKKRGLYAIPPAGQVVIIGFLEWNPAFPYVAGIYGDEYEADEFGADKFIITDGDGMKFIIDAAEKTMTIDNGKGSVVKLEDKKVTIENGTLKLVLNKDKLSVNNGAKNLFTVLDTFIQNVSAMKTVGSPAQHIVSPDDVTKFVQDKTNLGMVMEA